MFYVLQNLNWNLAMFEIRPLKELITTLSKYVSSMFFNRSLRKSDFETYDMLYFIIKLI